MTCKKKIKDIKNNWFLFGIHHASKKDLPCVLQVRPWLKL